MILDASYPQTSSTTQMNQQNLKAGARRGSNSSGAYPSAIGTHAPNSQPTSNNSIVNLQAHGNQNSSTEPMMLLNTSMRSPKNSTRKHAKLIKQNNQNKQEGNFAMYSTKQRPSTQQTHQSNIAQFGQNQNASFIIPRNIQNIQNDSDYQDIQVGNVCILQSDQDTHEQIRQEVHGDQKQQIQNLQNYQKSNYRHSNLMQNPAGDHLGPGAHRPQTLHQSCGSTQGNNGGRVNQANLVGQTNMNRTAKSNNASTYANGSKQQAAGTQHQHQHHQNHMMMVNFNGSNFNGAQQPGSGKGSAATSTRPKNKWVQDLSSQIGVYTEPSYRQHQNLNRKIQVDPVNPNQKSHQAGLSGNSPGAGRNKGQNNPPEPFSKNEKNKIMVQSYLSKQTIGNKKQQQNSNNFANTQFQVIQPITTYKIHQVQPSDSKYQRNNGQASTSMQHRQTNMLNSQQQSRLPTPGGGQRDTQRLSIKDQNVAGAWTTKANTTHFQQDFIDSNQINYQVFPSPGQREGKVNKSRQQQQFASELGVTKANMLSQSMNRHNNQQLIDLNQFGFADASSLRMSSPSHLNHFTDANKMHTPLKYESGDKVNHRQTNRSIGNMKKLKNEQDSAVTSHRGSKNTMNYHSPYQKSPKSKDTQVKDLLLNSFEPTIQSGTNMQRTRLQSQETDMRDQEMLQQAMIVHSNQLINNLDMFQQTQQFEPLDYLRISQQSSVVEQERRGGQQFIQSNQSGNRQRRLTQTYTKPSKQQQQEWLFEQPQIDPNSLVRSYHQPIKQLKATTQQRQQQLKQLQTQQHQSLQKNLGQKHSYSYQKYGNYYKLQDSTPQSQSGKRQKLKQFQRATCQTQINYNNFNSSGSNQELLNQTSSTCCQFNELYNQNLNNNPMIQKREYNVNRGMRTGEMSPPHLGPLQEQLRPFVQQSQPSQTHKTQTQQPFVINNLIITNSTINTCNITNMSPVGQNNTQNISAVIAQHQRNLQESQPTDNDIGVNSNGMMASGIHDNTNNSSFAAKDVIDLIKSQRTSEPQIMYSHQQQDQDDQSPKLKKQKRKQYQQPQPLHVKTEVQSSPRCVNQIDQIQDTANNLEQNLDQPLNKELISNFKGNNNELQSIQQNNSQTQLQIDQCMSSIKVPEQMQVSESVLESVRIYSKSQPKKSPRNAGGVSIRSKPISSNINSRESSPKSIKKQVSVKVNQSGNTTQSYSSKGKKAISKNTNQPEQQSANPKWATQQIVGSGTKPQTAYSVNTSAVLNQSQLQPNSNLNSSQPSIQAVIPAKQVKFDALKSQNPTNLLVPSQDFTENSTLQPPQITQTQSSKNGTIKLLMSMFQVCNQIGSGHFGKVYKAKFAPNDSKRTISKGNNKESSQDVTQETPKASQASITLPNNYPLQIDQVYALKIIKVNKDATAKQIDHLYNEKKCLMKVKPVSINNSKKSAGKNSALSYVEKTQYAKLLQTFSTKFAACFVMDYVEGINVFQLQQEHILLPDQAKYIAAKCLSMISDLHFKHRIVYRDIKTENLVLSKQNGDLTLVDFGFAKFLGGGAGSTNQQSGVTPKKPDPNSNYVYGSFNRTYTRCGTPGYSAPEVLLQASSSTLESLKLKSPNKSLKQIRNQEQPAEQSEINHLNKGTFGACGEVMAGYGFECDIWSWGVLLCELIGGYNPFSAGTNLNTTNNCDEDIQYIFANIVNCNVNYPRNMSSQAVDLLRKIFVKDPLERISIDDIKKSAYFNGVDWHDLDWHFSDQKSELARKSSYVFTKRLQKQQEQIAENIMDSENPHLDTSSGATGKTWLHLNDDGTMVKPQSQNPNNRTSNDQSSKQQSRFATAVQIMNSCCPKALENF